MKTSRFVLTAIAVFAVVGGALAYKPMSTPNLRLCSTQNRCIAQPAGSTYSSVPNGDPISEHPNLYTGAIGQVCGSVNCPAFIDNVYLNQ